MFMNVITDKGCSRWSLLSGDYCSGVVLKCRPTPTPCDFCWNFGSGGVL